MKRLVFACTLALWSCASSQPAASAKPAPTPTQPSEEPAQPPPAPADAECGGKACTPPEQCIRYYGIAGPSIPLYTCGLPCGPEGECPQGTSCALIADGPRSCR